MPTTSLIKAGSLLAAQAVRSWMGTLDFRGAYYDPAVDPARGLDIPRIYILWHEYMLCPLYLRGHCNLAVLLSQHRDADIVARVAGHMGLECVRGSTYRGGIAAVRQMLSKGLRMHLAVTPDGPRGPRRQLAAGPIYLASKLGLPLVALGFGYSRPWRVRSWDRFAIPRPYSRARSVVGPPVHVPAGLDRRGIESYRVSVERLLNQLTDEAEAWATSETRKAGEVAAVPQAAPVRSHRLRSDGVWAASPARPMRRAG